jgi:tetratricopeptide (TPR) repeat protein
MISLEQKLIEDIAADRKVSLERTLLALSGLKTEQQIQQYVCKLDRIHERFVVRSLSKKSIDLGAMREHMPILRARLLFEYLWKTKPRRSNSSFLLTDVIDAQLDPDINRPVGTCIGLTCLYTVLGLREWLRLTVLMNDSHMLSRLITDDGACDIEHTDPLGFNVSTVNASYEEYPVITLVSSVLNSRGMEEERHNNLNKALNDYNNAILLNDKYANAYNNRANIKYKMEDYNGALQDYNIAISLNTDFDLAYCNRALVRERMQDYAASLKDYDTAIALNAQNGEAYYSRARVKGKLGDVAGASRDHERAVQLEAQPEGKAPAGKVQQRGGLLPATGGSVSTEVLRPSLALIPSRKTLVRKENFR